MKKEIIARLNEVLVGAPSVVFAGYCLPMGLSAGPSKSLKM
jgi:hypothetical protein